MYGKLLLGKRGGDPVGGGENIRAMVGTRRELEPLTQLRREVQFLQGREENEIISKKSKSSDFWTQSLHGNQREANACNKNVRA